MSVPSSVVEKEALTPGTASIDATQTWRPLRVLNLYRLVVAGIFTVLSATGVAGSLFTIRSPELFPGLSMLFLFLALTHIFTINRRQPDFWLQVHFQIFSDLAILSGFLFITGGVSSGLGALMVVSIAGGSLLTHGNTPYVIAALSSLLVLAIQTHLITQGLSGIASLTQTGMLGAAFFGTAMLARTLARLAREQTRLATQRGIDLANMAELNGHIINHMPSGVLVIDSQWRVHAINARAREMLNADPAPGSLLSHISPELTLLVRQWSESSPIGSNTLRMGGSTEELYPRIVSLGKRISGPWLVFLEDAGLLCQQAQENRLASLGRLTASIAHEIRNPLSSIHHAGQLLEESKQSDEKDRRLCEIIGNNAVRVDEIIENALQLSRRTSTDPERINLDKWVTRFVSEFGDWQNEPPEISLAGEQFTVLVDEGHLHQIISNLVSNGIRHGGGVRQIEVCELTTQIVIDVIDKGRGIDEEEISHVFEPFYSTHSKGTGLGLYVASQIANSHRGHLSYHNDDSGSRFRLTLPRSERPE